MKENESNKKKITLPKEVSFDEFKSCVKYILSYEVNKDKHEDEEKMLDENQDINSEKEKNVFLDKDAANFWIGFLTKILGILFFAILFIVSKIRCFVFKKIAENSAKKNGVEILFEDKNTSSFSEKNIFSYLQSISTIFAFFIKIFAAIDTLFMKLRKGDKDKWLGKRNL